MDSHTPIPKQCKRSPLLVRYFSDEGLGDCDHETSVSLGHRRASDSVLQTDHNVGCLLPRHSAKDRNDQFDKLDEPLSPVHVLQQSRKLFHTSPVVQQSRLGSRLRRPSKLRAPTQLPLPAESDSDTNGVSSDETSPCNTTNSGFDSPEPTSPSSGLQPLASPKGRWVRADISRLPEKVWLTIPRRNAPGGGQDIAPRIRLCGPSTLHKAKRLGVLSSPLVPN